MSNVAENVRHGQLCSFKCVQINSLCFLKHEISQNIFDRYNCNISKFSLGKRREGRVLIKDYLEKRGLGGGA